jgi:uncharacterized protein YbjT (DUF2867 family)
MNYTITGGAGNISKPIALHLLKQGHSVSVISRNKENLQELIRAGAKPLIGSVEDLAFLKLAFKDADAVYTMVPPVWDAADWKAHIGQIGENYAAAIASNKVKYVVNLSSVGAHLPDGVGPVSGLYRAEQALNALEGVNIVHLRPAYFFANLLSNIGMIRQMNIIGGNTGSANAKQVLVDTADVSLIAGDILDRLDFTGHSIRYIAGEEPSNGTIARILGDAIGKPELPWVEFTDEQSLQGMIAAGLSEEVARNYTEMAAAIRNGNMNEDYWKHRPAALGKTTLTDFAKSFAVVYESAGKELSKQYGTGSQDVLQEESYI